MPNPNETPASALDKQKGWIGVDLDATLAHYDGWNNGEIGAPIPSTVAAVKMLIAQGVDVRIVTARAASNVDAGPVPSLDVCQVEKIQNWCEQHIGKRLPVQFWKDMSMIQLWDDRAIQFAENTGQPIMHSLVLLKNLCAQIYGCFARRVPIPHELLEQLRESCGFAKPEPKPLIVEAKYIPKQLRH